MLKTWLSLRLHIQLVFTSGLLLAISIAITTGLNISTQNETLINNVKKEAVSLANNLAITGSYLIITDRLDELELLLVQSITFPNITMLRLVSPLGETYSYVKKIESDKIKKIYDLSLVEIPTSNNITTKINTNWDKKTMTIWHPIKVSSMLGWVEMKITLNDVIQLQQQAIRDNVRGAVIAILFNMLVLFAILTISAKGLKKVANFANNMPDEPGNKMQFTGGSFEINNLIQALNITSSKLSIQHDEINEKSAALVKINNSLEQRVSERTKLLEEKNIELERFTYTASHDLKSPLVTISGFIGLLKKDISAGDEARIQADLITINDAVQTMQQLLDDLLELSRIGRSTTPHVHVNLNAVVDGVLKMLSIKIKDTNANITIQDNMPSVIAEKTRMKEIYLNLIENALKYSRTDAVPEIHIGFKIDDKDSSKNIFFVKDKGIGIEPPYHKKIFDLFERINSDTEGTGVGLAIVKRIIEIHNGKIWIESDTIEPGSTFYFTLS